MRNKLRKPNKKEVDLINFMLSDENVILDKLENCLVRDLKDNEMGSVEFVTNSAMRRVDRAITKEFLDKDGVVISVSVNIDQFGDLYEVDIWRVDFFPVQSYPAPENIRMSTG